MSATEDLCVADGPRGAANSVFAALHSKLERGEIVPGQRLVEADLAVSFSVSRNSVREALQRLAADGVIELSPNRGASVRLLTRQETVDVLEVAERMNGLLARAAARAVDQGADPKALAQAFARVRTLGRTTASDEFSSARRAFYHSLVALAGSRELQRLLPSIQVPIVYAQHRPKGLHALRLRDYPLIAAAVLNGREEAADLAATAHVMNVRDLILQSPQWNDPSVR